jgi:hypothetical protein
MFADTRITSLVSAVYFHGNKYADFSSSIVSRIAAKEGRATPKNAAQQKIARHNEILFLRECILIFKS